MSTIAIKPGASKLLAVPFTFHSRKWAELKDKSPYRTTWSGAQCLFVWGNIFAGLVLLALPVSLTAITLWTLLGYLWLLLIPASFIYRSAKTSDLGTVLAAYRLFSQLKEQWAEYGLVFYQQVWDHDCDGEAYISRGEPYYNCRYCKKRIQELSLLVDSQRSVEYEVDSKVADNLFEASKAFRQAVEESRLDALRRDDLMREIASSASKTA